MLRRIPCRLGAIAFQNASKPRVLHHIRLASFKAPGNKAKEAPPIKAYTSARTHHGPRTSNTPPPNNGRDWNAHYATAITSIKWAVVVVLTIHIFVDYFYLCTGAYGISMLPNLNASGDSLWISKYYRRGRGIQVGDLVSFQHPVRVGEFAVKRVMGLEGDFVLMNTPGKSDAMLQVGSLMTVANFNRLTNYTQIPEGHCWVVGDNLPHSRDSRMFGPLPMALIAGKVIARWGTDDTEWLPRFSRLDQGLKDSDEYENTVD